MPFSVDHHEDGTRLRLRGDVTVREAASLHATLCELGELEGAVVVDDAAARELDTSALQLLIALMRARRAAGRPLTVTDGLARARLGSLALADEVPS